MRYLYSIPTVESMTRQAPRPDKPLTAEQVVAQNQRERAARQATRRRLSPSSPKKGKNEQARQSSGVSASGGPTSAETSSTKAGDDSDGEGSGSEGEDGYTSSTSNSSVDQRTPAHVRQDVLSEVNGSSGPTDAHAQNGSHPTGDPNGSSSSNGVPDSLKVESHENIIYLAGNSLGLQSRSSYQLVNEELIMWQTKCAHLLHRILLDTQD